jgi:hypothetical protein
MRSYVSLVIVCLGLTGSSASAQERGSPHFGFEAGVAQAHLPNSIADTVQDRYRGEVTGWTYALGLTHFHGNGAPSYSLQLLLLRLDGKGYDLAGSRYTANARLSGFLATKYANIISRSRGSIGFGYGAGVGPQFKATYRRTEPFQGVTLPERTYTLKTLPVTPLFQIVLAGDIRLHRNLSFGPYVGLRNGLLVYGGMVRVRFVK